MGLIEKFLYGVCLLSCLSSAGYMTYLQFKYYLDNEDFAAISHRKFNQEQKDEYPSLTICLFDTHGGIFKRSHEVFTSTNVTRSMYRRYLLGDLEEQPSEISSIKFDDVVLDINDQWLLFSKEKTKIGFT